ncbi:hypothetical protein UFOVP529_48 [uncultured Caudovirales phage]|uniref:WYL domain containing protein n=1 Tax=uncultured Caudovirales phage TaxID=2100421 RepID=A0A6J5R1I3_9CAUD|nr:hypothetical protein UFOVP529_48 [uncultured Caudovirales phage]CAB4190749.1 hypothetical protein UFOVP1191_106 [uncultured Caudovirales phage]CAB4194460.1 hypothetical protein UFOVP1252_72 [uncultured Caudovirales phage]
MKTITAIKAAEMLAGTEGKIFSVKFVKRTTGEVREMVARTGVKAHLKGGDAAYSFSAKSLLSVYDLQAKGYRSIPLDAIVSIKAGGEEFTIAK